MHERFRQTTCDRQTDGRTSLSSSCGLSRGGRCRSYEFAPCLSILRSVIGGARPMLRGARSDSTVRSQVWRGRPARRLQSLGKGATLALRDDIRRPTETRRDYIDNVQQLITVLIQATRWRQMRGWNIGVWLQFENVLGRWWCRQWLKKCVRHTYIAVSSGVAIYAVAGVVVCRIHDRGTCASITTRLTSTDRIDCKAQSTRVPAFLLLTITVTVTNNDN